MNVVVVYVLKFLFIQILVSVPQVLGGICLLNVFCISLRKPAAECVPLKSKLTLFKDCYKTDLTSKFVRLSSFF